uniref:Uncharacterized protein n=1 Tax=Romanomermis culicivorax TaxID=13658 RepID=A0A915JZL1_ROMCU
MFNVELTEETCKNFNITEEEGTKQTDKKSYINLRLLLDRLSCIIRILKTAHKFKVSSNKVSVIVL